MRTVCFLVGAMTWLSMSASAQVHYTSQARSVSAQSINMPESSASAPDFGLFHVSVQSNGTPESQSNGRASAGQNSYFGPMQMRCTGGANPGKSNTTFSGYGTASSDHLVSFFVTTDTPVNFKTSLRYGNLRLTGPGINFVHGYVDDDNESGILLANKEYVLHADTQGDIQVGNAVTGSFEYTLTLGVPPAAPTGGHSSPTSGVCIGAAATVSVAEPPAGHVIDWYYDNVLLGTGTTLDVYPTFGPIQTFQAQTRRVSDGAVSVNMKGVDVFVKAVYAPFNTQVSRDNVCQYDTGTITLTASASSAGTYQWSAGECGGSTIGTGYKITIPAPRVTTTYYVRMVNECQASECLSQTVTVRSCPGDFTCNGSVADDDFAKFITGYNLLVCSAASMPAGCPADLNADGFVDDADFEIFVQAYDALVCP